ncbi:MAG: bifunctional riboflavin kinase/FAD synthetase [Lachnospiraceae bacterium]|nr:bifunctional riboflavin kinase/FAD synthetase [Lachnospiraceae bacterium]
MQIIAGSREFHIKGKTAIAIGKFDGIHKGHQKLLAELLKQKENGLQTLVFTFDPSPATFFSGRQEKILTTKEEKQQLFSDMGIDILVEFPMDQTTADMLPEQFVDEILIKGLHAGFIAAGTDLSFGKKGMGNSDTLERMAVNGGYRVEIIDKVCIEGREISSTYVREEVAVGHMETVNALCGNPYRVHGTVSHGKKLGSTKLGIPTVNLIPEPNKLLPPNGVYFSYVHLHDKRYYGMTNIGCKPTVKEDSQINLETFLYDFEEDVYGEEVLVELLSFRRPEQKFESLESLKKQMTADVTAGREYFSI